MLCKNYKGIVERMLIIFFVFLLILLIALGTIFAIREFINQLFMFIMLLVIIDGTMGLGIYMLIRKYNNQYIKTVIFNDSMIIICYNKKRKYEIRYKNFKRIYRYKNKYLYETTNHFQHSALSRKGILWSDLFDKRINNEILEILKSQNIEEEEVTLNYFNNKGSIDRTNVNQFTILRKVLFG